MEVLTIGQGVTFIDSMSGWLYTGTFLGYGQDQFNRKYATVGYVRLNGQNATARVLCSRQGEARATGQVAA